MKQQQQHWLRSIDALIIAGILHCPASLCTFAAEPPRASTSDDEDLKTPTSFAENHAARKPLLVQMAEEHEYCLAEGEDVRRIAPPFDPIRAKYYRTEHARSGKRSQRSAIFDAVPLERPRWWAANTGKWTFGGHSLRGLFDVVAGIKDQMVEGPDDILSQQITGDWVVRVGTKDFRIVKQLEEILAA